MGFEKPPRPAHVDEAVKKDDLEKILIFASAGGPAGAKVQKAKREEKKFREEVSRALDREMQERREWSDHALRPSPTEARRDDLLPSED